jgi:hypothetical protein
MGKIVRSALQLALVLTVAAPAQAAPITMDRDRADNSFYFSWDADLDEILEAYSATRLRRGDRVRFYVYVRDPSNTEGDPLAGVLKLALRSRRAVRYEGTFILRIRDAGGQLVHVARRAAAFTMRPKDGFRRKRLAFQVDLPSGIYTARARFTAE